MKTSILRVLKWLRWPNLLIVFITMAFIRYGIIAPALKKEGIDLDLSNLSFMLLSLTTLLITFGGYVINDILDQETDANNKGEKRAIGVWMSPAKAMSIYLVLGFIGFLCASYLAWTEDKWQWLWIYPLAILLLWWYSKKLKSSVLWGNILVSLFCAGVALLIPFSEMNAIATMQNGREMMQLLYFYAGFAGISNFFREIIKDVEDVEGDRLAGLQTLAVKHGIATSRNWALAIGLFLGAGLFFFYKTMEHKPAWSNGFFLFTVPLLVLILLGLVQKPNSIKWKKLSQYSKLLMLAGLLGMLFLI